VVVLLESACLNALLFLLNAEFSRVRTSKFKHPLASKVLAKYFLLLVRLNSVQIVDEKR